MNANFTNQKTTRNNVNVPMFQINEVLVKQLQNKLEKKYSFPAKMKDALIHREAAKFGYKKPVPKKSNCQKCPCCNINTQTEHIGLCYHTFVHKQETTSQEQQQYKLTSSVLLFFCFIKMLILFLVIKFLIVDIYNIITNLSYGRPLSGTIAQMYVQIWTKTSIYHKMISQQTQMIINTLNLVFIVFSLIFFRIAHDLQFNQYCYLQLYTQTEEEYSIFIENLSIVNPMNLHSNQDLQRVQASRRNIADQTKTYFKNIISNIYTKRFPQQQGSLEQRLNFMKQSDKQYKKSSDIVQNISLCYYLKQLAHLQQYRQKIMKEHEKICQQCNQAKNNCLVQKINENQIDLCRKYASESNLVYNLTHFSGCAIVSFQYQFERDYIIDKARQSPQFFQFNGKEMRIYPAPPPSDILWLNLAVSDRKHNMNVLKSYSMVFLILLFSFVVISAIQLFKYKYTTVLKVKNQYGQVNFLHISTLLSYALTILASLSILLINFGLKRIMKLLTEVQRHKTRTRFTMLLIQKLLIAQFFNSAIIYWIVEMLLPFDALGNFNLLFNIGVLMTVSATLHIIINAIFVRATIKKIRNWWKYRNIRENAQIQKFQVHLNYQIQYAQFSLSSRYVYYISQLYTILFYSYIVPLGSFIFIFILTIQYWIDKYNLFNRSSLKYNLSFYLDSYVMKAFELSIVILALGNMIFSYQKTKGVSYINLLGLIIAVGNTIAFIILPYIRQANSIDKTGQTTFQTYLYNYKNGKFRQTYWHQNPATQIFQSIINPTTDELERNKQKKSFGIANQSHQIRQPQLYQKTPQYRLPQQHQQFFNSQSKPYNHQLYNNQVRFVQYPTYQYSHPHYLTPQAKPFTGSNNYQGRNFG